MLLSSPLPRRYQEGRDAIWGPQALTQYHLTSPQMAITSSLSNENRKCQYLRVHHSRAVSKHIGRYGERMKTIPFYKYMLLFFREKNNPMLYPISSHHANLKVTEGKDNQRSLKQMSKVQLFQEVVEGRTDILNKSIKICSPKTRW